MNSTTSSCSFAVKLSRGSFSRSASVFACHTLLSRSSRQNRSANCCHSSPVAQSYGALRVKHTDLPHPAPPEAMTLFGSFSPCCFALNTSSKLRNEGWSCRTFEKRYSQRSLSCSELNDGFSKACFASSDDKRQTFTKILSIASILPLASPALISNSSLDRYVFRSCSRALSTPRQLIKSSVSGKDMFFTRSMRSLISFSVTPSRCTASVWRRSWRMACWNDQKTLGGCVASQSISLRAFCRGAVVSNMISW